jgi:DNA-binding phage protein
VSETIQKQFRQAIKEQFGTVRKFCASTGMREATAFDFLNDRIKPQFKTVETFMAALGFSIQKNKKN